MEGIEEEMRIFQKAHGNALMIPVGSIGAAALNLWNRGVGMVKSHARNDLLYATRYPELFRKLLF